MMEVAQCCMLGCPDTTVLVRRIAEVVAGHMGGPVIDATEMFTKWLGKSIEQRTSHQTSLLPIGRIDIGLSRHRALLFKVRSLPFRRCVEWQLPTFQLIYWLTCLFHQKEKSKPYFLHWWSAICWGCGTLSYIHIFINILHHLISMFGSCKLFTVLPSLMCWCILCILPYCPVQWIRLWDCPINAQNAVSVRML